MLQLLAKVTEWRSSEDARFQCCDVHFLWANEKVTVEHFVEDQEWGASEVSEESTVRTRYPMDFFSEGVHRTIHYDGHVEEEPLPGA